MLNQLINIGWTLLAFIPILVYLSSQSSYEAFYIFLVISLTFGFLPKQIFDRLQISRNPQLYKRLGVKRIRQFVQDGDIINRAIRKDLPQHCRIRDRTSLNKYLKTVEMYERYHFICLIFFLLISIQALMNLRYGIGALIITCNFLYNACPILLQQFNKSRILKLGKS